MDIFYRFFSCIPACAFQHFELKMADPDQHLQWSAIIELLTGDKNRSIKTLDTVFVTSGTLQWYFTSKSGSVSKKKKDSTSVENIIDRFARFSLSNPFNTDGIVGVLVEINSGLRKWMKKEDLATFLRDNLLDLNKSGSFLQVYLRPMRGADVVFSCESNRVDDGEYNHEIIVVHQHGNNGRDAGAKHEVTDGIQTQITEISEEILTCLRENYKMVVDQITIECIVDDNQHAWLSSVSHCELVSASADSDVQPTTEIKVQGINITHSPTTLATRPLSRNETKNDVLPVPKSISEKNSSFDPYAASLKAAAFSTGNTNGQTHHKQENNRKEGVDRKKKKKDLKTGELGFRRSLLDEPPSVELMAKFAAERDR